MTSDHHGLVRVEIGDVGRDAALELEHLPAISALVDDDDLEAAVQVGELAQLGRQLVEAEFENVLEDLRIGMEGDLRAMALAGIGEPGLLELRGRDSRASTPGSRPCRGGGSRA